MSEQPFLPVLSREAAAGDSLGCQSQVSGRNHKQSREAAPGVLRGRRMTQDTPAAASRLTHVSHTILGLAPKAIACRRFAAQLASTPAAASRLTAAPPTFLGLAPQAITCRRFAAHPEAERAIELLQERRTALISAAVTGKIDVRGFVPKETA